MITLNLSKHAVTRATQRGFRYRDIEEILTWGTDISNTEMIITKKI